MWKNHGRDRPLSAGIIAEGEGLGRVREARAMGMTVTKTLDPFPQVCGGLAGGAVLSNQE